MTMDQHNHRLAIALIKKLLHEKRPLALKEIADYLGIPVKRVVTLVDSFQYNFERYNDGRLTYVKPICKLELCALHCSKNNVCNGSIPHCTGLHICKFFILSGSCKYKNNTCNYGHDLTTTHNMHILREHNLNEVDITDIKYLLLQTDNRTSMTIPKICKFYNVLKGCRHGASADTQTCPNLHVCKHYIMGECQFGKRCKRSHDMLNSQTRNILQRHGINTSRTPKEILAELRSAVRDGPGSETGSVDMGPVTRWASQPVVSQMGRMSLTDDYDDDSDSSYDSSGSAPYAYGGMRKKANQRTGPKGGAYGGARPKTARSGGDRGGLSRSRSREAGLSHASSISSLSRGMSTEKTSDKICLFNLRRRCAFGQSCQNHHCDLPYQWQFKKPDEDVWENCDVDSQREIELSYSDPKNDEHFLQIGNSLIRVTFTLGQMKGADPMGVLQYFVRRLSTPSSEELEQQPLATIWMWHWQTQTGVWQEYGDRNATGYKSCIISEDIEQAYLSKPEGSLSFATQGHEYVLDFKKMHQRNLKYKTERAVCRRPLFVNAEEAARRITSFSNKAGKPGKGPANGALHLAIEAPQHWDIQRGRELIDHFDVLQIVKTYPATRKEYKDIETQFCESMPSTVSIKSIERIENGELWLNYVNKKARMRKKNKNQDVEEKRLFHGTKVKYVDAICKQGFDFRLNGQTCGTLYGKGSYFATSSKYSDSYTDQNERMMFVVKVLVGEYTKGTKTLVRPPSKDTRDACSELYDSCVDNQQSPSIFVIFDNNGQVYPEYLVKYEMKFS